MPHSTCAAMPCAPHGTRLRRRRLLLLLLLGVVGVGSTAGREGVPAVGDGAAAGGGGAELLAFARERAALCAGAHCAGAVVVGFSNMGCVSTPTRSAGGRALRDGAAASPSRDCARQRVRGSECDARVLRARAPLAAAGTASLRSTGC